jgi:hypothetical protein
LISAHNSITFKSLFSIVSFCGVIFLLGEITNFLLIRADIIDSMLYALPNRFPYGLDIFALGGNPHPALALLLNNINPFTIWYFTALSVGISTVAGLNKKEARMLSFIIWINLIGFLLCVLLITGETRINMRFEM